MLALLELIWLLLQGSLELGIIYAIMTLGVFISFRTLNMPDMTVDGSFTLGAAAAAMMCSSGRPFLGLAVAFTAGCMAGSVTALLNTRLKIQALLSGILMMLALYSVNLRVMGNKANIPLLDKATVYSFLEETAVKDYAHIIVSFIVLLAVLLLLFLFLKTRFGFALRATGDNEHMVRALGVNTDFTIIIGLAISNGLVALSGALIAQYQSFADVSMGVGMVSIGLASVIIGEAVFGTKKLFRRLSAVILGAILYRLVIGIALEFGMPPTDLKLVSALIVVAALSIPTIRERTAFFGRKVSAQSGKRGRKA